MNGERPGGAARLAFVSPLFLFPNDAGGKIRTTNILRGLKGGAFDVTLLSPATPQQRQQWQTSLAEVCDRFEPWPAVPARPRWQRSVDLLGSLPVNVANDRTPVAREAVARVLGQGGFDVVVFDFVHAAVLRPQQVDAASVCFTHNVEAEIFARHAAQASNPLMRWVWAGQHRKMQRYENTTLSRFDAVVAVSDRDARHFAEHCGLHNVHTIPTGVDLDFFAWRTGPPADDAHPPTVVFTGSMDWAANVDGVRHFLADVWPLVRAEVPQARFVVVGRNPPAALVQSVAPGDQVHFTGFVDDVRPHVHGAHVFTIPLRVGGGTRIKAFEAMAMGCPVVSTAIGIEGLAVVDGEHFLCRDAAADQARAIVTLLRDGQARQALSVAARRLVESRFGHRVAAAAFERICLDAQAARRGGQAAATAAIARPEGG